MNVIDYNQKTWINEKELLLAVQEGDEHAFSCLFSLYKDKLYRFLLKFTHSEATAKDLVQDIFLKLWLNRETALDIINLNAYLYQMAQNHALNEMNRYARTVLTDLSQWESADTQESLTPCDTLIAAELKEKIEEAINHLSPQQQKIYGLHKEQGISHAEIARQLNLSVSTIQNHFQQAVTNLRRYLSHAYPGLFLSISVILSGTFTIL